MNRRPKGYTLVELLVLLAIGLIICAMLPVFSDMAFLAVLAVLSLLIAGAVGRSKGRWAFLIAIIPFFLLVAPIWGMLPTMFPTHLARVRGATYVYFTRSRLTHCRRFESCGITVSPIHHDSRLLFGQDSR